MLLTHMDDGHVTTASYFELLLRLCKVLNSDVPAGTLNQERNICLVKRVFDSHGVLPKRCNVGCGTLTQYEIHTTTIVQHLMHSSQTASLEIRLGCIDFAGDRRHQTETTKACLFPSERDFFFFGQNLIAAQLLGTS
jgi:hypothetical protein